MNYECVTDFFIQGRYLGMRSDHMPPPQVNLLSRFGGNPKTHTGRWEKKNEKDS